MAVNEVVLKLKLDTGHIFSVISLIYNVCSQDNFCNFVFALALALALGAQVSIKLLNTSISFNSCI